MWSHENSLTKKKKWRKKLWVSHDKCFHFSRKLFFFFFCNKSMTEIIFATRSSFFACFFLFSLFFYPLLLLPLVTLPQLLFLPAFQIRPVMIEWGNLNSLGHLCLCVSEEKASRKHGKMSGNKKIKKMCVCSLKKKKKGGGGEGGGEALPWPSARL